MGGDDRRLSRGDAGEEEVSAAKGRKMTLTTEDLGDTPDIAAAEMDALLAEDSFGKFVILSTSEEQFIQAACEWEPTPETEAFLALHRSDPWILEYRQADGRQFQANGHVTLDQVRGAFAGYLAGDEHWKQLFKWHVVEV